MIPIQPTNLWRYLDWQKMVAPTNLHHLFYASWEDALWDLLVYFKIKAGSTVLVPDFFCGDVIINMAKHGLVAQFYSVDQTLQTEPDYFAQQLKKWKPSVVVIFHPVGISNTLWRHQKTWLPFLPASCLLIEDSVHRVVDPQTIQLVAPRHVVIDSLRKVVPLPGANLYLDKSHRSLQVTPHRNSWYSLIVLWWWIVFQLFLGMSLNSWAERAMLCGYNKIGKSQTGTAGWWWVKKLAQYLSPQKITTAKKKQVAVYQENLTPLFALKKSPFFAIPFTGSDAGNLRGFPVGLHLATAAQTLQKIRSQGLLIRFELNDSPWSKKYKIMYLPLGPHLSLSEIHKVCQTMQQVATV